MDVKVQMSQEWINSVYNMGITVDGKTGWPTINALIRCLQKELEISPQVDFFGTETSFQFERQIGSVKVGAKSNIVGIIQCAMWCKGYSPNSAKISTTFNEAMADGVNKLRIDAGLDPNGFGEVDLTIMKALLSMDQYKKIIGSEDADDKMRKAQQHLNGKYLLYSGLMPCDGLYGRNTNKAVIFGLQAEMGMTRSGATGSFGPKTKAALPTITSSAGNEAFIYLFKMALYANMSKADRASMTIDGVFDYTVTLKIKTFQTFMKIPVTGIIDKQTWCAVLISCGDNERKGTACDRATPLTASDATTLYNAGYQYIGRYLSGTYAGGNSKAMTRSEIKTILNTGMRIYPIFQEDGRDLDKFTPEFGLKNAKKAFTAAKLLGIPLNTIIYFAVDFDALDYQIKSNIIPYFKAISEAKDGYRVGIYGTRNVCNQVIKEGFAELAFVSDMSYGWSGNLGFPMPEKWAFDQIRTIKVGTVEIDNNIASGADTGFGEIGDVDLENLGEGPYRIISKIAKSKYCMATFTPLENAGFVKLEEPANINNQLFYLKKGSLSENSYLISPATNTAASGKEYVLDRYMGTPKNVADTYVRSDADKNYQEVKLIPQGDGSYQISLVGFNLLLTADVGETSGTINDKANYNMKWLTAGHFSWDTTQQWILEPTALFKEDVDPNLSELKVGQTYTISTNGKYLGVRAGAKVYAGAPVELMEGNKNSKSIRWKLLAKPAGSQQYAFAPVYNTSLAMDVDINKTSPYVQVNMNAKPQTVYFEHVGDSKFLIRAGNSTYPLYLSVERPEIDVQASFIDKDEMDPTVWDITLIPDDSSNGSGQWTSKPKAPPTTTSATAPSVTGLDPGPTPVHPGSGLVTGDFTDANNNGDALLEILQSFYGKVFGITPSENDQPRYAYFIYGEYQSGLGYHQGVDMNYNQGGRQPVYSAHSGKVINIDTSWGQVAISDEAEAVIYVYAHMDLKNRDYAIGDPIKVGQQLGIQSNVTAGKPIKEHLHFEVVEKGRTGIQGYVDKPTDPMKSIMPYGYM